jgi:hypothetical protein
MRVRRTASWAVLAAIATLGCSSTGASQPKLVWLRDDGTPATREELLAARDACSETVDAKKISPQRRFGYVEYTGQVTDCIKAKGYHLVDAPAE